MAGNDDGGKKFAEEYDSAAKNLVSALSDAKTGAGALARRLVDTGNVWSDAEYYASGGKSPPGLAWVSADISEGKSTDPPSAVGGSMALPPGWEWIQSVSGAIYPNGDTGKLRNAAKAWDQAASDLELAAAKPILAQISLASIIAPESSLVESRLQEFRNYLTESSSACRDLGEACNSYATGLDTAHNEIMSELIDLLAFTVIFEAGAAALAVFTVGSSVVVGNVAVVARVGLAGTRVTAIIARVAEIATSVGSKVAGVASAITRMANLLKDLKVVKTITYAGSKAPAWVKLTSGMAVNTGILVGSDALANGGKVDNLGADLAGGIALGGLGGRYQGAQR